jgi:two-component system, cell cycle response regulator DivK
MHTRQKRMKTILLVDDQLEFRAIQSAYLRSHGYQVLDAGDGEAAVRIARDRLPDLILMDFSLRDTTGDVVTQSIKADPATRNIPVVMLTAQSYGSVGGRARTAGCVGFLAKPIDPSRVLREVREHVG